MPACSKCGAKPPINGLVHGWLRLEFYGAAGAKYGYYCPNEQAASIAADVQGWADTSRHITDGVTQLRQSDKKPRKRNT